MAQTFLDTFVSRLPRRLIRELTASLGRLRPVTPAGAPITEASAMFPNLVTYAIHRGGDLPPSGAIAYQYLLAENGVFIRAAGPFVSVLAPVLSPPPGQPGVRGLAPLTQRIELRIPRLPGYLLAAAVTDARQQHPAGAKPGALSEALYYFQHQGGVTQVVKPEQSATAASVTTRVVADETVVLDLHSHGNMPPFWSGTDNRDEQGLRFYGVMGNLGPDKTPRMRLRLGVYGYHVPVPVTILFDGTGGLTDAIESGTDDLPPALAALVDCDDPDVLAALASAATLAASEQDPEGFVGEPAPWAR